MKKIMVLIGTLIATQVFADTRITISKGDASMCEVVPTKAQSDRHYNKKVNPQEISSDLWRSAKNGLSFFHLNKSERRSQTIQLAFVDKYSTFWYYIKNSGATKGPYFYDFVIPENSGIKFVDIDLELPCSCFEEADKPQRCSSQFNRFQYKFSNWWQQTGHNTAKKIGNKIGKGSHKIWDAAKKGWSNVKDGWENYQNK